MLTLRTMNENGKWLPKSKNVYALDENGNRIRAPNGSWKRVKVNTVDWNERKYGEIWRQDWAAAQNAALEAAGRMERVDMRSLERQGVEDRLPQKHLGPTASALETIRELKPVQQEYKSIHWSGKREKYKAEHGGELNRLQKAIWLREKLIKSLGLASHLDKEQRMVLKAERTRFEAESKALLPKIEEVKAEMVGLNRIRYWTRKVIPDALPRVSDGRVSVGDAVETAVNRKELEQVINDAKKNALRQSDDPLQTNQSAPIHFLAI